MKPAPGNEEPPEVRDALWKNIRALSVRLGYKWAERGRKGRGDGRYVAASVAVLTFNHAR
jgi:hypothetical protein